MEIWASIYGKMKMLSEFARSLEFWGANMFCVKLRWTESNRLWVVLSYASYDCMGYVESVTNVLHFCSTILNYAIGDESVWPTKVRYVQQDPWKRDTEQRAMCK